MSKPIIYDLFTSRFYKRFMEYYNKRPAEIQQAFKENYFIN
ncbi:hypothetical protein SAMN04488524_4595 [Pedobacter africanus]|uniref:Uncharacterized protein n=1 Tax=Pedobacter africanus TaxID=151894 RepID=A0A1W2E9L5_9SPHI|nr:hypothetical protein SAMN04488524_4595 [Pedobacter africanus]